MGEVNWDRDFALEQAGQDEELLAELLKLFNETSAEDLAKIHSSFKAGDSTGMGDAAHSIKGAAASLGIDDIRRAAYEVEKAGRGGDIDTAQSFVPELESLIIQFRSLK